MIDITNLHKRYGKIEVLKGVNLSIDAGKTTAILGPNGSGKTTLIKSILGIVKPTTGDICYLGKSILNQWLYRNEIAYLPQIARFPENLKVKELVHFIENLRDKKGNYEDLVNLFELKFSLEKRLRNLSGGTRQKVNLLLTFMFDCPVYILDEPTSGLDPVALIRFKTLLNEKRLQQKTILITTHIIHMVEEIADEMVFLLEGNIYYQGSCEGLLANHHETDLEKAIASILLNNHVENIKI